MYVSVPKPLKNEAEEDAQPTKLSTEDKKEDANGAPKSTSTKNIQENKPKGTIISGKLAALLS